MQNIYELNRLRYKDFVLCVLNETLSTLDVLLQCLKHDVPQHRKDKLPTEIAPQILFIARTTTPKSLKETGFVFLLQNLCLLFHV